MSLTTAPTVTRNNVDLQFTTMVIGKKSKENQGKQYFAPELDESNAPTCIQWMGISDLFGIANARLRQIFQDIMLENLRTNDGVFNQEQWTLEAAEFSAEADRLSVVEDKLEELQDEQFAVTTDPNFGSKETVIVEGQERQVYTSASESLMERIKEINAAISPLKVKKAAIEQRNALKAEKRKATKEANAAKEALAKS